MPELKPALLMPYSRSEMRPRQVTSRTPEPLVPVTDMLRRELQASIRSAVTFAVRAGATEAAPAAVKLRLRPKALAKSKRPYGLLADVGLTPMGATVPGELLLPGTPGRLRSLAEQIARGTSKLSQFHISTLESIAPWDTIRDVFGVARREDAEAVLEESADLQRSLRVTFFPWVSDILGAQLHGTATSALTTGSSTALVELFASEFGLDVVAPRLLRGRPVAYLRPDALPDLLTLEGVHGIRTVALAPEFSSYDIGSAKAPYASVASITSNMLTLPTGSDPIVGVLDSGVESIHLESAVTGRQTSVADSDTDRWHGTFVAGLIMAGGQLNDGYPDDVARVHDAHVVPKDAVAEGELFERVRDAVIGAPDIKVWNCSFASRDESAREYGTFAVALDDLSDEAGVLFVQAAGNLAGASRSWPPTKTPVLHDGLASPAEALRSITVGARAHLGGRVDKWAPASYSRRGPNFADLTKPDVSHAGGDHDPDGDIGSFGILSVVSDDFIAESLGTSFATPAVSAIAANLWDELLDSGATTPTPELIKGLLVHSAYRNSADDPTIDAAGTYRQFYGWGTPSASSYILADEPHTLTTVHEVVMTPGVNWYKPLPVPPPLLSADGKFSGEVTLTISYAPPIDVSFGAEAIRYDVTGGFGAFRTDHNGIEKFTSITHGGASRLNWEAARKADGKWSPVKTQRAIHPQGVQGGDWALRLEMVERVSGEISGQQRVYVIVTFRSLDANVNIYAPGVQAFNAATIASKELIRSARIRVNTQPTT